MTDQLRASRVDSVLRRLDVAATPDDAFVRTSASVLLAHAARARNQDGSVLGRIRREFHSTLGVRVPVRRSAGLVMLGLIASLLLAGLLLLLAGSRPHLPPSFGLAGNGRIAFVNGYHIFTSGPLGGDARQLTFGDGGETEPRFSPDGSHIAFRRWHRAATGVDPGTNEVVVAASDGSDPRAVSPGLLGMGHMAWSPDSRFLAYTGSLVRDGPSAAYVVPADGSSAPITIGDFGGTAWDPTWSPDGTRLALAADAGLFVVDRDGRNARTVNHGVFKEFGSRGEAAEWSPDGTSLLFTAIDSFDLQDVFVLTLDGSAERNVSGPTLLARREAGDPTGIRARDASYSPDGTRMAYMRTGFGDGPICVIADSDGDRSRPLAGAYGWYQPIWSPDGTKVVVTDDRPGPDNNEALPAVRVILDVAGSQPPIEIPAPGSSGESIPDWAATWQRVGP